MSSGILGPQIQMWPPQTAAARNAPADLTTRTSIVLCWIAEGTALACETEWHFLVIGCVDTNWKSCWIVVSLYWGRRVIFFVRSVKKNLTPFPRVRPIWLKRPMSMFRFFMLKRRCLMPIWTFGYWSVLTAGKGVIARRCCRLRRDALLLYDRIIRPYF